MTKSASMSNLKLEKDDQKLPPTKEVDEGSCNSPVCSTKKFPKKQITMEFLLSLGGRYTVVVILFHKSNQPEIDQF